MVSATDVTGRLLPTVEAGVGSAGIDICSLGSKSSGTSSSPGICDLNTSQVDTAGPVSDDWASPVLNGLWGLVSITLFHSEGAMKSEGLHSRFKRSQFPQTC